MQSLDIITLSSLFFLLLLLMAISYVEVYIHHKSLKKIPNRIHVNGTRGKSSVVRLIAAGLRAGGLKTFAKTTGSCPRIINEKGKDVELHRLRSASIGEQIKLIRYFSKYTPDVLVMECMAVNPQYQWISEHKIVKSTLGVITNVRLDHIDEMGSTLDEISYSLSNTIPFNSKVYTSEKRTVGPLSKISLERNSTLEVINDNNNISLDNLNKFSFIEHPENISLALKVCEFLGVENKVALDGMINSQPDPGALFVWDINVNSKNNKFVSAFAANDPNSTSKVWQLIQKRELNKNYCVFLNCRNDRRYRTIQLIELVMNYLKPDLFILRGDDLSVLFKKYTKSKIKFKIFPMLATQKDIINHFGLIDNFTIVGIGNIVGWGDKFIKKLKKYKIND